MDRRSFLRTGVAISGAGYLLSQVDNTLVHGAPSVREKASCPDPAGAWLKIDESDEHSPFRKLCILLLRETSPKYWGLVDQIDPMLGNWTPGGLKARLAETFDPPHPAKKLNLYGYFEGYTEGGSLPTDMSKLILVMAIKWGNITSVGNRIDPRLKMIALNPKYFPAASISCTINRLKWAAKTIDENVRIVAPRPSVDLTVSPGLHSKHVRELVVHARSHLGQRLHETPGPGGTLHWRIDN